MARPFYTYTTGEKLLTVLAVILCFFAVGFGLLFIVLGLPVIVKAVLGDWGAPKWFVLLVALTLPMVILYVAAHAFRHQNTMIDNWLDDDKTNRETG